MSGKRRSHAELSRDRRRMADLYMQGWLQVDIAAELGIDQSTVSRDLKALHDEWLSSALVDFNTAKANELAKIDRLEREYWTAWIRSQEDAESIITKGRGGPKKGKPESIEKTVQTRGQSGDPRFLQGVQWCIERRCKILGIDSAIKAQIQNFDLSNLSDIQLQKLAEGEPLLNVLAITTTSQG